MNRSSLPIKSVSTLTAIASLLLALGPTTASARKVGGAALKASNPADDTCASYSYSSISNSCTTAKTFILALPFDTEGYKNVSFVGQGASASNDVSCRASGMNTTFTGLSSTATVSLPAYGSVQTVSLGSTYVWNPGSLYLLCTIQPGGKLFMVQWDE